MVVPDRARTRPRRRRTAPRRAVGPGFVRQVYGEKWARADWKNGALFALSVVTTLAMVPHAATAVTDLLGPSTVTFDEGLLLLVLEFFVAVAVRETTRTTTVPLSAVESVERAGRTVRVEREGDDPLELRARSRSETDSAVEIFHLEGVAVENRRGKTGDTDAVGRNDEGDAGEDGVGDRDRLADENR